MISRSKQTIFLLIVLFSVLGDVTMVPPEGTIVQLQFTFQGNDALVARELELVIPASLDLVNQAIEVLSDGLDGMNRRDRQHLLTYFDPADTGDIDSGYVETLLANYRRIKRKYQDSITIDLNGDAGSCEGMRLYYTDLTTIHVCPYYITEVNSARKARTFLHEMAHRALLILDRPYYRPTNKRYARLTPRGPWTTQIPLIGPVIREILRQDTLYHPDAYAHFALAIHTTDRGQAGFSIPGN